MNKRIGIFGGTGLIGNAIIGNECFSECYFYIFIRSKAQVKNIFQLNKNTKIIEYNGETGNPIQNLDKCDIVINLAGASIGRKRWTKKYKKLIYDSRIDTTRKIIHAIGLNDAKPELFISSSATGIYGSREKEELNEKSSPGDDFLSKLCTDWEREALKAEKSGIRTVLLRSGIVLSNKGGALDKFIIPFKCFIGGHLGTGKQWISWIHIDDLISAINFIIMNQQISGVVNCTTKNPVTNKEFSKVLGDTLSRPSLFFIPARILRIVIGEFSESIISGQKVFPEKLIDQGFSFKFPDIKCALENLLIDKK